MADFKSYKAYLKKYLPKKYAEIVKNEEIKRIAKKCYDSLMEIDEQTARILAEGEIMGRETIRTLEKNLKLTIGQ
jgi:hypothetical protein